MVKIAIKYSNMESLKNIVRPVKSYVEYNGDSGFQDFLRD